MKTVPPLAYLQNIKTIAPQFEVPQSQGIAWIMKALQRTDVSPEAFRALNLYERLLSNDSIQFRRSVLEDYMHHDWSNMLLFKPSARIDGSLAPWSQPPLQDRMKIYVEAARALAREAFSPADKAPAYIIDISCTGYRAPYPLQELVLKNDWANKTRLLKLGHMGCYASVPGLHLAAQLSQSVSEGDTVSVLSTELCTLHLDPLATDPDQVVSNILFADGCARMDIGRVEKPGSLALHAHYEALVPDSSEYMAWDLQDSRFHMTLSRKVVTKLNKVIGEHLNECLSRHNLNRSSVTRYAIHPGGPRIVESIQEELGLAEAAVKHSKMILRQHGNMSSATLPHVWKAMQDDVSVRAGEVIVSMAFGPGLTVAMNVLQKT
ncbi:MAG: hypothetical protein H7249_03300 [Chitinophagaceae bacterium]|nr:hypothetical protein [Oligoflexus sp.]